MNPKFYVLGDGGWGTTIALLLNKKGYEVTLWGVFPEYIKEISERKENYKFLPKIRIPGSIRLTSDIKDIGYDGIWVVAIPSKYLRETIARLKNIPCRSIVSLTKGIEENSLMRSSEVITEVLRKGIKVAVISGPTISYEVAREMPATVVCASEDRNFCQYVQRLFATDYFRVYASYDVTGVEAGGALKNIIAIASGISDGMGFGVNTKAALLTRGLAEIARLGVKMGAQKETFFGLSGLGDLATTCMSLHSRNRSFGEEIGRGKNPEDVLKETEMAIEGVTTAKAAYQLSKKLGVEMPITEKIYQVLYEGKNPKDAVTELMSRPLKPEI